MATPLLPAPYFIGLHRAFWSFPDRTMWTPCLAGLAGHLFEIMPGFAEDEYLEAAAAGVRASNDPDLPGPVPEDIRQGYAVLAHFLLPFMRDAVPERLVLGQLHIQGDTSMAGRVAGAERWLDETDCPAPWAALILGTHLTLGKDGIERFLRAERPFVTLSAKFRRLAARQSLGDWAGAATASLAYWRDSRGDLLARLMIHFQGRVIQARLDREAERRNLLTARVAPTRRLLAKLERRAAAARAEAQAGRDQLAGLKREQADLTRLLLQARQARDRAIARTRAVEAELAALKLRLAAEPDQAGKPEIPERAPGPVESPAALRVVDDSPGLDAVFAGRRVYLFTGAESAGMRHEMGRAFERHGATCEVFDGNRLTELGPERFEPEAIIVIETRNLCHAANDLLLERARASGAWYFVGRAGAAGLARKVAERWRGTGGRSGGRLDGRDGRVGDSTRPA